MQSGNAPQRCPRSFFCLGLARRAMAPPNSIKYHGCTITPRTFEIRGSGQWTLDLVIERRAKRRFPAGRALLTCCFETDLRPTVRTRYGFSVEPAVAGIFIFRSAVRAKWKTRHARIRTVIRELPD